MEHTNISSEMTFHHEPSDAEFKKNLESILDLSDHYHD